MKITMRSALLVGLALLFGVACGTESGEASSLPPATTPQSEAEAQVSDQEAFDTGMAAQGEAVAQPVSPELQRELEAGYQASLVQREGTAQGEHAAHHDQAATDFDALFVEIRDTMPPGRGTLLRQYIAAAEHVSDPDERAALLLRLSSQELDNVP